MPIPPSIKKLLILRIVVTSLALVGIVWFLVSYWSEIQPRLLSNPGWILVALLISLVQLVLRAWSNSLMFRAFSAQVTIVECVWMATIANSANFFLPMQAGAVVRATYLKKKYQVEYSQFVSTFLGVQLLGLICGAAVGMFVCVLPVEIKNRFLLLSILMPILLVLLTVLLLVAGRSNSKPMFLDRIGLGAIRKMFDGLTHLLTNRVLIGQLVTMQIGIRITECFMFWSLLQSAGIEISAWHSLLITSIVSLSGIINLTPNNIGIQESLYAVIALCIGISPAQCVATSLTMRLLILTRSLGLLPVAVNRLGLWNHQSNYPENQLNVENE